jgi:hypothetical protein
VRSLGPYTFESYGGKLGVNATIINAMGKRYFVSIANLLPFKGAPSTPQVGMNEDDSLGQLSDDEEPQNLEEAISGDPPVALVPTGAKYKGKALLRYSRRRLKGG